MSLEKDQGFRDRGTGGDKVGPVSRRRRKAERQVGREDFSKPWAEADKKRVLGIKEVETGRRRREGTGGAGLTVLLSCGLCSRVVCWENPIVRKTEVLII